MISVGAKDIFAVMAVIVDTRAAVQLRMMDERFGELYSDRLEAFAADTPALEAECRRIGLPATAAGLARARGALDTDARMFLRERLDELRRIFLDEVASLTFLIPPRGTAIATGMPFGADVASRFPEFIEDIEEANKCLALGLGTAAVFHLMRVMERAIQRLARGLRVKLNVKEATWHTISQHAENGIKALPTKTARQKTRKIELGSAVAHLNAVRITWRNSVMHPKATYTVEEAQGVFAHVGLFLQAMVKV